MKDSHGQEQRKRAVLRHTIRFTYTDPAARRVCVAGTFNDWKPEQGEMTPTGGGKWCANLSLKAGTYEYRLVVDDRWMPDPKADHAVWSDDGIKNSLLMVAEED